METFKCMRVYEEGKQFEARVENMALNKLEENEVLIRVEYSSLNYKDALSASGNKGVTRHYPHTPGIDAAGHVISSSSELFSEGDKVIVTGYDLGMNTHGGFSELISVPAAWVVPLPIGLLSTKEAMMLGTAGFTAALSIYEIMKFVKPEQGPVLVTGATGGVGTFAIKLLKQLGYEVIALSSKITSKFFLKSIGVSEVILMDEFLEKSDRLMLREEYAALVDTVGGQPLSVALKSLKYGAMACACGNAADFKLNTNVYPFILRGITLKGIDSVLCPVEHRLEIWRLLSTDWKLDKLEEGIEEITLEQSLLEIGKMLEGQKVGRSVIKL